MSRLGPVAGILQSFLNAPIKRNQILRQTLHEFRMLEDYVTPKHGAESAFAHKTAHLQQKGEISLGILDLERLIATDVEKPGRKIGKELAVKPRQELQRLRIGRIERCRFFLYRSPRRNGSAVRHGGKVVVFGMDKPSLHVAERILVRHKFDVVHPAVGVQFAYLRRCDRRRIPPYGLMPGIAECVFRIKLKLVVVADFEYIHDPPQGRHRRNLVPADVQHVSALLEHSAAYLLA